MRTYVRVGPVDRGSVATILHADLDSFYASVEQRDDPALRGRPVIVGGGVVLAASYEAKAYGVRTAMGGRAGPRGCARTRIVVPPRMSAYSAGQRRGVRGVPRHHADRRAAVGGRGVPRRVAGCAGSRAPRSRSPRGCAREVRDRVGLPITVGIARTKFLAKVASQEAKPDGLLLVPPDRELAFLHPLPVRRLWGVGVKTAEKLHAHGIETVADVAELSESTLGVDGRRRDGPSAVCVVPQHRSPPGGDGRAPPLGRRAAGAGPARQHDVGRGDRRRRDQPDRPDHPPDAQGRAHRPHRGAAVAVRRLRPRHPVAHDAAGHRVDRRHPRHRTRHWSPRPRR